MLSQTLEATAPATVDELLTEIRRIGPILEGGTAHANSNSELAPDVVEALDASGVFFMSTPKHFGGLQMGALDMCRVIEEIARYCGSAAWVVMIVNGCNAYGWRFSEQAQKEVFGPGKTKFAQVISASATYDKQENGYIVSGEWGYASGVLHDNWVMLGNREHIAMIPVSEIQVKRTWDVVGMRGSGSHTVVADSVFVPEHRVASLGTVMGTDQCSDPDMPVYARYAPMPTSAALVGAVLVGLADRACTMTAERSKTRVMLMSQHPAQAASEGFQSRLGECFTSTETARQLIYATAKAVDDAAEAGILLPPDRLVQLTANIARASRLTTSAMDDIMHLSGSSAFANSSQLAQIWRDLNTGARHAVLNPFTNDEAVGAMAVSAQGAAPSRVQK